jgi:dipeptidyl aminopeptidase/acylaminoacyl peptidase
VRRDPDPGDALRGVEMPGEAEAEERSWELVRAAYAERTPSRPAARWRGLVLAVAGGAAALAIVLSPAGAKVGDLVEDMGDAVGIGKEDARPALRSLPAAGELLVESEHGPWIVREDGSKRLLGDYDEASWSPRGLFVAVTDGRELLAVEPDGDPRWTIDAPAPVHDPRWGGIGFDTRIAYRSGGDLWVVDGDGSDERLLARNVAPQPPVWLTPGDTKIATSGRQVLGYLERDGDARAIDVDTRTQLPMPPGFRLPPSGHGINEALSPDGSRRALVSWDQRRSRLVLVDSGRPRVLFSGPGRFTGPTWSPDGRWLLIGWREADQWLFIDPEGRRRPVAIDRISEQFDPGGNGGTAFPRVSGWILPER